MPAIAQWKEKFSSSIVRLLIIAYYNSISNRIVVHTDYFQEKPEIPVTSINLFKLIIKELLWHYSVRVGLQMTNFFGVLKKTQKGRLCKKIYNMFYNILLRHPVLG